jgi:hypothetical protein
LVLADIGKSMLTLEIRRNGNPVTCAGRADLCVLDATVSAVGVLGPDSAGAKKNEEANDIHLYVGGLTSKKDGTTDEHLTWTGHRSVAVGDKITIRIHEAVLADLPIKEGTPVDEAARERQEREVFEGAKSYYLEHRARCETDVG